MLFGSSKAKGVHMSDHESEPREQDEDLTLEKEKLRDLDVPDEESADIKGGGFPVTKSQATCHCA